MEDELHLTGMNRVPVDSGVVHLVTQRERVRETQRETKRQRNRETERDECERGTL